MIPVSAPKDDSPDELVCERTALRDAGPVTPTVLAVAGTALAPACHTGSRLGPSCRPGSSRGGHLVGLPHHRPTPLLPRQPHRSLDRNHLPLKHPELSDWKIVVYGYRLVVAWQEPAVEGTASLVLLMPYSVNVFLDEFNAGGHHRLVSRRRPWSRGPRTTPPPTPPGTPRDGAAIAKRLADTDAQQPDPGGARRVRWWPRRRARAILRRPRCPVSPSFSFLRLQGLLRRPWL